MSEKDLAKKIVELIGGKENIASVQHCATRLRIRRIHKVIVYSKDGSIKEYDSVKAYMERDEFIQVKDNYDYVLIDCMPSLGMLTINALTCADSVLIPVQAAYLPVKGLQELIKTVMSVKRRINHKLEIEGILLTMVDSRTNLARIVIGIKSAAYTIHKKKIRE